MTFRISKTYIHMLGTYFIAITQYWFFLSNLFLCFIYMVVLLTLPFQFMVLFYNTAFVWKIIYIINFEIVYVKENLPFTLLSLYVDRVVHC